MNKRYSVLPATSILLLSMGLNWSAAQTKNEGRTKEPSYIKIDRPKYSVEYPKGWTVDPDHVKWYSPFSAEGQMIPFVLNALWHEVSQKALDGQKVDFPWAEITIQTQDHIGQARQSALYEDVEECDKFQPADLKEFLLEFDCTRCDPSSCKPCETGDRKNPRLPVGSICGNPVKILDLPLGKGYLYEIAKNREFETAESWEFEKTYRQWRLYYDIKGSKLIHQVDYFAPNKDFEKHIPHFVHIVESFRIKR